MFTYQKRYKYTCVRVCMCVHRDLHWFFSPYQTYKPFQNNSFFFFVLINRQKKNEGNLDQKNLRFFRNFFCSNHEFFFFGGIKNYEKVVGILIFDFLLLRRMNNFWKKKLDKNKFFENYSFLNPLKY